MNSGKYDEIPDPYPIRAIDAGIQYSLSVVLMINSNDLDYLCGDAIQGFKIMFHSPFDYPNPKTNFFDLSPKTTAFYSIEPKITVSAKELRKYGPEDRQCYFKSERKLRFYRIYTKTNCIRECLSNFTLAKCGCVHFSMQRKFSFVLFCFAWIFIQIPKRK